mgnify:CR=1 FL=1
MLCVSVNIIINTNINFNNTHRRLTHLTSCEVAGQKEVGVPQERKGNAHSAFIAHLGLASEGNSRRYDC